MGSLKALIDADLLVYEIGYVFDETVPERTVMNKVDDKIESILNEASCTTYICYLTKSDNNFRNDVATVSKYKGQRLSVKPYHWQLIRDYIQSEHEAVVADGCEADDLIGDAMLANPSSSVICSRDKDLDTIPSWHYGWRCGKHEGKGMYYVEPEDATRFLYKQMLMGDSTDNILGVYGIGTKKAEGILERCSTKEEMQERIRETYICVYGEGVNKPINYQDWRGNWIGRTPEEIMGEMYELLFIGTGEDRVLNRQGWCGGG